MTAERTKIYFAADAHLGARFHKDPLAVEKKLVRWMDSIKNDAIAVYFLGDMVWNVFVKCDFIAILFFQLEERTFHSDFLYAALCND